MTDASAAGEVGKTGAPQRLGFAGRLAGVFVSSPITPLIVIGSVLLGLFATVMLPREEEPQIIVPMVDIFVAMPGSSAREVEERVTTPMEQLLAEIPGVEYVYTTASPGLGMAVVRFFVGEDEEQATVRLNDKLRAHFDIIPAGASMPLIKPRSIDDVPILALTFWSERLSGFELRRLAAEVGGAIKRVTDVSQVSLIGGERRQVRVLLDPAALSARRLTPLAVAGAVEAANVRLPSGSFAQDNREILLETGGVLSDARAVEGVVVGVADGRPVLLRDVAEVRDGGEEATTYVRFGHGAAAESGHQTDAELPPETHAAHAP